MNDQATAQPKASMDRSDWLCLGGLLFVLFATRIVWILWNPEATMYWEEDYRWVVAREIIAGPHQPVFDYQADNYQGGSLVLIGLITGMFAVFGETLLSLKLAPLAFAGATLAAIYTLGRLWFGRRTALIAAGGYLLGPPLLVHSALIPMGSHGESALFSLVQIICFLGILSRRWHTPRGWAALGFVSGLGLWFCYTSGLSLAACGVTWLILEGIPKPRLLLAATGGALLGLIPWIAYNLQNDFTGLSRLLEIFGVGDPIDAWVAQGPLEKFFDLIFRDLPIGMLDPFADLDRLGHPILTTTLVFAFYIPVVIALAAGLGRVMGVLKAGPRKTAADVASEHRRSEFVFFVYALIFLAAYLGSSFAIEPDKGAHAYRLLLPLVIMMWVPVAISLSRAFDDPSFAKNAATIGLALTLVSCTVSSVALAIRDPGKDRFGTDMMDHVYRGNLVRGVLLHRKYEQDLTVAFDQARRIPGMKERFRIFEGIGWGIEYRYEGSGQITPFLAAVNELQFGEHVAVLAGLIWATETRVSTLEESVASGEGTPRDGDQLHRLTKLKAMLEKRWRLVPIRYRHSDQILY
ncbi:MAG: glycosyltransferase family 39 protein [Myxococcales bacterium]|nr:glycosyltransferase family 39 protein [Myxococcales bacterium]